MTSDETHTHPLHVDPPTLTAPSLKRNSVARLVTNGSFLIVGFASATITARVLGPASKGTLSSMLFIVMLLTYASSIGLGDAAIVLMGRKQASLQQAMASSLAPAAVISLLGIGMLWLAAWAANWFNILPAVIAASLVLPIRTIAYVLVAFLNSLERFMLTSLIAVTQLLVDLAFLIIFVLVLRLGITGGVLADLIGSTASLGMLALALRRAGYSLRPALDTAYVRAAAKVGTRLEAAYILMAMTQRLDLLIVYALSGEAVAGHYAIALTIAQLVAYASNSLSAAAFPRLARIGEDAAAALMPRIARTGLAAAIVSAGILLPLVLMIPAIFGRGFAGAVAPTLVLIPGVVIWSQEWALTRAVAARGSWRIFVTCFATNLTVMLLIDAMLIPRYGAMGASIASVIGPSAGLLVFFAWYRRQPNHGRPADFLPRREDFVTLFGYLKRVVATGPRVVRQTIATYRTRRF